MLALKVTNAFADRSVGDTITEKAEMKDVLASNPGSVVRVQLSDEEEAAVKAERAEASEAAVKADTKAQAKPAADTTKTDGKTA